jgi:hypothetical protein
LLHPSDVTLEHRWEKKFTLEGPRICYGAREHLKNQLVPSVPLPTSGRCWLHLATIWVSFRLYLGLTRVCFFLRPLCMASLKAPGHLWISSFKWEDMGPWEDCMLQPATCLHGKEILFTLFYAFGVTMLNLDTFLKLYRRLWTIQTLDPALMNPELKVCTLVIPFHISLLY